MTQATRQRAIGHARHAHAPSRPLTPTQAVGLYAKALYRIPEAMVLLNMSRTVIYEQMRAGRLRTVAQGRSRRITPAAIADYVALLETEAERTNR